MAWKNLGVTTQYNDKTEHETHTFVDSVEEKRKGESQGKGHQKRRRTTKLASYIQETRAIEMKTGNVREIHKVQQQYPPKKKQKGQESRPLKDGVDTWMSGLCCNGG